MAPFEVCRKEEGQKGGGMKGEREEGRKGEREEGRKGGRRGDRNTVRKRTLCLLWYLKKRYFGILIPRFSPCVNENPTASNETNILPLAIELCKYMYQTFTTLCM